MTTRIVELSTIIAEKTKLVDEYFKKNGIPTPSFGVDGPARVMIPPTEKEASEAHTAVLGATKELNCLLTGPTGVLMSTSVRLPVLFEIAGLLTLPAQRLPQSASCVSVQSRSDIAIWRRMDIRRPLQSHRIERYRPSPLAPPCHV